MIAGVIRVQTRDCFCQTTDGFTPGKCLVCGGSSDIHDGTSCTTCEGTGACRNCGGTGVIAPDPASSEVVAVVLMGVIGHVIRAREANEFATMNAILDETGAWLMAIAAENMPDPEELARQLRCIAGDVDAHPLPQEPKVTGSALTEDELRDLGIEN